MEDFVRHGEVTSSFVQRALVSLIGMQSVVLCDRREHAVLSTECAHIWKSVIAMR